MLSASIKQPLVNSDPEIVFPTCTFFLSPEELEWNGWLYLMFISEIALSLSLS